MIAGTVGDNKILLIFTIVANFLAAANAHSTEAMSKPLLLAQNDQQIQLYENYDLTGETIRSERAYSPAECSSKCQGTASCVAFTFDKWANDCVLKKTTGAFRFDPKMSSALNPGTPVPLGASEAIVVVCVSGFAFKHPSAVSVSANSAFECKARCTEAKDCVAFTFTPSDQSCKTMSAVDSYEREDAATSGVKRQLEADEKISPSYHCPKDPSATVDQKNESGPVNDPSGADEAEDNSSKQNDEPIQPEDRSSTDVLAKLSCADLWVKRNQIYKDHGYCFKTPRAVAYFGNQGCRFSEMEGVPLSDVSRATIAMLKSLEIAKGCTQ